jgi:hypothetical protein
VEVAQSCVSFNPDCFGISYREVWCENQFSILVEGDQEIVKSDVVTYREQQAIIWIEPLDIVASGPRLDVRCPQ